MPAVHPGSFAEALNLLQHRGPDGFHIWADISNSIMLGHRRLAIQDCSENGIQPLHYKNRYTITYNGEIYNFPELRKELSILGHHFFTNTDTEIILAAFDQWGNACWEKLNGMWALAIWDHHHHRLTLCRDRFGKKPLYYVQLSSGRMAFASEMKALIPFLPEIALSEYFGWMSQNLLVYESTNQCLIKNIFRFPAGHWGVFKNNSLQLTQYWNTLDHIHAVPAKFEAQAEEFKSLFLDACKIRMRADAGIGTALSGGIDSSAVLCSIAYNGRNQPDEYYAENRENAFIATMPGTPLDEVAYAEMVTDYLNIAAVKVQIDPVAGLNQLPEYLYLTEDIYITSPVPMMQTYAAAKMNGVSVCIDGHGADELFAGYDTFMFNTFLDCGLNPFQIKNLLETYRNLAASDNLQFAKPPVNYLDYIQWVSSNRNVFKFLKFLPDEIKKLFLKPKPNLPANEKGVKNIHQLGNLNSALFRLFHYDNLPTLLRNYDRYSMASGVEIRMPFLDHRIVSYCFSVPYTSKFRNGYTKALLRYALASIMPEKVAFRRSKMGFQTPIANWMKHEWKPFFLDTLQEKEFQQTNLINTLEVSGKLVEVIQNPNPTYRQAEIAYSGLIPYLWHKYVFKRFQKIPKVNWQPQIQT